ncbi:MAG: hypothetical protein AMJ93_16495 [Anaerolineae bacterium SM23_84]|nr:MAG: hypothetical protein AMJ93_16495 [Anaerolineae bacterium SM23_84]
MRQIQIRAGDVQVIAELNDNRAENAQAVVSLGDLGYWPAGNAFCIFFGPTPVSRGQEIRPASPVNVFGRVIGDPTEFKKVRDGETVTVEQVRES